MEKRVSEKERDPEKGVTSYAVVINHEEQYSIWPVKKGAPPKGWKPVGFEGTRARCLAYIEEVWTDMRPLSLRRKMEEIEREEREKGK